MKPTGRMVIALPMKPLIFPDRPTWLAERSLRIQASDSAAIFGVGYKTQSVVTIWQSKVSSEIQEVEMPKRVTIGTKMEPVLRELFTEETGLPCVSAGGLAIYVCREYDWIGATLDALTLDPAWGVIPLELKNVDHFQSKEWDNGGVPLKFEIQCHHQMLCTDTPACYLFGLIGGNDPLVRLIKRNDTFIAETLVPMLRDFWGYVQRNEVPPVDASEATALALWQIYSRDNGECVMLPAEAVDWDRQLRDCKELIKKQEEVKTLYENRIKAAIGSAAFGQLPNGGGYDWKTIEVNYKAKEAYTATQRRLTRVK